jgi:kojibiose phosphorylase
MTDSWSIPEDQFHLTTNRAYEGLFTQGSGVLHVRGSLEEHLFGDPQNQEYTRRPANVTAEKFFETKARWGTFIPGVRGLHPLLNRSLVNLPFFLDLAPFVDGEKLDMEASQIEAYSRRLDLRTGLLSRAFRWRTRQGASLQIAYERFISASIPQLCLQRLMIAPDQDVVVTIRSGIDADVRTSGYDMFARVDLQPEGSHGISCRIVTNTGDQVWLLTRLSPPGAPWRYACAGRAARLSADFSIPAGSSLLIEKRTAVHSNFYEHSSSPPELLAQVADSPYDALLVENNRVWWTRWEKSDVVIEGDDQSQLALRTSIYHLLRAHPGGSRLSIDPKGYAGDAYRGCYFWDTEIYMLPFFLYTNPDQARSLLEYRIQTLSGAQSNAAHSGYRGARFAWEADTDGTETCPNWQYRDHEIHVTADIVYALSHYARAALDDEFLHGRAAPLIVETARFWLDRLDWRVGEDFPGLLGVMGPDEYKPLSNNNSFTNRMAAYALALASHLGEAAGATPDETKRFSQAATGLKQPRSPDGRLVLQSEEFDRLPEPPFERFWKDRSRPFAAKAPQEWLYRTKCIKQADVLLLMMLFPAEFTDEEVLSAWDYYLPFTTHDSSLSPGVHAIIASRLGKKREVWEFWEQCSQLDLDIESGGAAEGIHMANAGLNWQIAVFGFGGLSSAMETDILTFHPHLPDCWSRLAFPLAWRGNLLRIEIQPGRVVIDNLGPTPQPVMVRSEARNIGSEASAVFQLDARKDGGH